MLMISSFSSLAPMSTGLFRYKHLTTDMKLLLVVFILAFMTEMASTYLFYNKMSLQWVHHLYTPLEYTFMVMALSYWQLNSKFRKALRWSIPIFILICLSTMIDPEHLKLLNGFTASLAYLTYGVVVTITLINLQKNDDGTIFKNGRFWFCSGMLLYSAGALVFFVFNTLFLTTPIVGIWIFHLVLNTCANIIYSIGFLLK